MQPSVERVYGAKSLTKRQLDALLHRLLGQGGLPERELTGGMFNTAYRARLRDGRTVLVKIAPPADLPVLRYERGILGTGAAVYRWLPRRSRWRRWPSRASSTSTCGPGTSSTTAQGSPD